MRYSVWPAELSLVWREDRDRGKGRAAAAVAERRPGCRPVWSQSMTVPSQLSLGTKQKAHQEQDGEEEAEEGGWSSSLLLCHKASWWSVSPAAQGGRSGWVQLWRTAMDCKWGSRPNFFGDLITLRPCPHTVYFLAFIVYCFIAFLILRLGKCIISKN